MAILDFRNEVLAIFDVQVTSMLPTKFQSNFRRRSKKIDFQNGSHLGFPIGTILVIFLIYKSPRCFLPSFKSIGLSVQGKKGKIYFQDGSRHCYLGFPNRNDLAIFDLLVHPIFPNKFQASWTFGSGE